MWTKPEWLMFRSYRSGCQLGERGILFLVVNLRSWMRCPTKSSTTYFWFEDIQLKQQPIVLYRDSAASPSAVVSAAIFPLCTVCRVRHRKGKHQLEVAEEEMEKVHQK